MRPQDMRGLAFLQLPPKAPSRRVMRPANELEPTANFSNDVAMRG